ncbi:MAG: TRAP transporter substrate-binding protein DctP [Gammaproteobacteria bacterium]|nr:TRAP transporter substrate-binding protein DctP [Gammaproteobacteria bacterium]
MRGGPGRLRSARHGPRRLRGADRRSGRSLHGAAVTAGALTPFYSDIQLYNLPMVFRDYDEVDAVRAELDPVIEAGLRENGFEIFGPGRGRIRLRHVQQPTVSMAQAREQKVCGPGERCRRPCRRSRASASRRFRCPSPMCSPACRPT